jgi:hypothetical protein
LVDVKSGKALEVNAYALALLSKLALHVHLSNQPQRGYKVQVVPSGVRSTRGKSLYTLRVYRWKVVCTASVHIGGG